LKSNYLKNILLLLTLFVGLTASNSMHTNRIAASITRATEAMSAISYHFGFSIQPTANTGLVTYAIIGERDGQVVSKQIVSLINFILQMKGEQSSLANPNRVNLFETYALDSCFYYYDLMKDVYGPVHCFSIDDLWMIRYSRNPLCSDGCIPKEGMKTEGWAAGKFRPNDAQMNVLEQYGVIHFNQFIYGENMLKLFKDMANEEWQLMYKSFVE
jgi:hypothetical protein